MRIHTQRASQVQAQVCSPKPGALTALRRLPFVHTASLLTQEALAAEHIPQAYSLRIKINCAFTHSIKLQKGNQNEVNTDKRAL